MLKRVAVLFAFSGALLAQGRDPTMLLCAGCHGMAGEGRSEAGYPRIAGQLEPYLLRQLEAYADGRRPNEVMTPLAKPLSAGERARLAAHFADQVGKGAPKKAAAPPRGAQLAVHGDEQRRVQACQNCHGPQGRGVPPYGAYLAGLHAGYLKEQLMAFREGRRHTDASGAMPVIARHLTPEDIDAVSAYYASLTPPPPRPEEVRAPGKR